MDHPLFLTAVALALMIFGPIVTLAASVIRAHLRSAQRLTRNATPPADTGGTCRRAADLQLMKADPSGGLIFSVRERGANSAQQGSAPRLREKSRESPRWVLRR